MKRELKRYERYKDSGFEWLGEVPEGWKIKRLKELVVGALSYGANESAVDSNPLHPRYIRITDFLDDGMLKDETFKSLSPVIAKSYLLREGDILFARSGATAGKTFQFKNYDGLACYAGYLIRARPKQGVITSDFLNYFTKSFIYENWKNSIIIKATIENISAEKYGFFLFVATPPLDEQQAITAYLDEKTAWIDKKNELLNRKADRYQELKQALINETVTRGLDPTVPMKDSGVEWIGEVPAHWKVKRLKDIAGIQNSNVDKKSYDYETKIKLCNYVDVYKNDFIDSTIKFMEATANPTEISRFIIKKDDVLLTKDSESFDDIGIPALVIEEFTDVICGYHLTQIRTKQNRLAAYLFRLLQSSDF
ncbi:restriction endonuclease subunit S [Acetobacterium wieringae]|uniref:restriction endonuclease subunit S n=1 Tax=Acetobacterium wieringae TaxID=52694 RepID=UPI002B207557|nr:restriction endonuclease subunit S [Acetobacterium wieringae]MEA4807540.1 restriction endonuclease subunit S [Acetobacterium wieringae]